jgi:hypothetical protein
MSSAYKQIQKQKKRAEKVTAEDLVKSDSEDDQQDSQVDNRSENDQNI